MGVEQLHAVPHLTTVLTGPLQQIERHFLDKQSMIEAWLRAQWLETPAPFYASVDLRNAGFKVAPVDTNLFPAGFNNLNPSFLPLCIHAIQSAFERVCPTACQVLLVPENHTRNIPYFESLATLQDIILRAGYDVRIGTLSEEIAAAQDMPLPSGRNIRLERLVRDGRRVGLDDFDPCVVLLNNDLSDGQPPLLQGLEQPVVPSLELGWSTRLKSAHFQHYHEVINEFVGQIDIDPWLLEPLFRQCGEIDFMKREGEDCLAQNVTTLLAGIQRKYNEYRLDAAPYVVVKADSGTYGMGIMTVQSPDEIRELNRRQRTRMAASKGGHDVTKVILQEGVPTFETWGTERAVAEPVVYMIDHFVVGGFYRVHTKRGPRENLNAPGMHFEPLSFADTCNNPDQRKAPDASPNRFYAYGVIARLALVAGARELAERKPRSP